MNIYGEYSMLAMVTAGVIYMLAVLIHAAEWASARGTRVKVRPARTRSAMLAGAVVARGAGTDAADPEPAEPAADTGPTVPEPTHKELLRTEKLGRIGLAITTVGVACHAVGVILRGVAAGRAPWGNMYEFTTTSLLVLMLAYLVVAYRFGMRWLGLLAVLVGTIGLGVAVTVFYVDVAALVPALHSAWFLFHVPLAAIGGAAMNLGAIASILYLVRKRAEEKGTVRGYLAKLPDSARLDRLAYRLNAFAFPLWTIVIAAGAIWAQYAWGRYWNWDPKETFSLVTWAIYAIYLHARATAGWKGTRATIISLVGVVSFWWNFVGVNLFIQGLHSYAK
ncbi:c-type cytochrome biogenesis protein CcsB [Granulicoccus phenolivorans]|uniref:c-type cytochrome biogenesis protein CcsB n=1 Tax=Granulicoccus phenolivorans TaxID=266854 RepID=UPI0003FB1F47|nr:c-type cytochrome biogenesis protein CcsB [Granulicoccus phenolivorans]